MHFQKGTTFPYDIVICVASQHKEIALKTIRSLHVFAASRKIFVITAQQNFAFFQTRLGDQYPVCLLDEDNIIENISLHVLQDYFMRRIGNVQRAGWYFQQFLKMSACLLSDIADHYLIWDSDTILLQPLRFFDHDGNVLIHPKTECHPPYFVTLQKLLGIGKQVSFSFISEHFMIKKAYMIELLDQFRFLSSGKSSWVWTVLDAVADDCLGASGFSEFETYGNFIAFKHADSFRCRSVKSTRYGAWRYGTDPNPYDLFSLMLWGYGFASFETWQTVSSKKIFMEKILSTVIYGCCFLLNHASGHYQFMIDAAHRIAADEKFL